MFAFIAFMMGQMRSMRSGNALLLRTWPPIMMNGLPSTKRAYFSPFFTNCGMGLACAKASEEAQARVTVSWTNLPTAKGTSTCRFRGLDQDLRFLCPPYYTHYLGFLLPSGLGSKLGPSLRPAAFRTLSSNTRSVRPTWHELCLSEIPAEAGGGRRIVPANQVFEPRFVGSNGEAREVHAAICEQNGFPGTRSSLRSNLHRK